MSISNQISQIHFKKLDEYNSGKLLGLFCEEYKWKKIPSILTVFKHLLYNLLTRSFSYEKVGERGRGTILFAFNEFLNRQDYYEMFYRIYECAENATFIRWRHNNHPNGICTILNYCYLLCVWNNQLKALDLSIKSNIWCLNYLLTCKKVIDKLPSIDDFTGVVVPYDAKPANNVCCQKFRINHKWSATAQHGVMCSTRKVPFYGMWFRYFVSDYFLAWNEVTVTEALKDGLKIDSMPICGIARCIGIKKVQVVSNKVIGVLLDGHDFLNQKMITIVENYCAKNGYKYLLRYHPSYQGNEYNSLIDKHLYVGNSTGNLYQYANGVEFTVLANSTALLELLFMNHRTYVFSEKTENENFHEHIPTFNSLKELENIMNDPNYINTAKKKLVGIFDIEQHYKIFFSKIDGN